MSRKVVIRLNNPRSPDASSNPRAPEIVVYRWDRIIGAALVLVALVAGLIFGARRLGGSPEPSPAASNALPADPRVHQPVPATAAPLPEAAAESPIASGQTAQPVPAQTSPPEGKSSGRTKSSNLAAPDTSRTTPPVTLLSNHVKRAQLTSNVIDNEPVDRLGGLIPMNDQGLIKVYLFMETAGLGGTTLFHDWYWKGKRMAHARLPVLRPHGKAASSKFIDRIMTGAWEVRIVDEKSRVLAKAAFVVQ